MPWTSEELDRLGRAEELRIAGRRADGTVRHPVIIWAVVVDGALYLRSVRGREGAWYLQQRHGGRIESGGVTKDVVVEDVVANDALQDRIDAAYAAKYPQYASAVDSITSASARATTLRVAPS